MVAAMVGVRTGREAEPGFMVCVKRCHKSSELSIALAQYPLCIG